MSFKGVERLVNDSSIFRLKGFKKIAQDIFEAEENFHNHSISEQDLIKKLELIQLRIKNFIIVFHCDTLSVLKEIHRMIKSDLGINEPIFSKLICKDTKLGNYAEWNAKISTFNSECNYLLKITDKNEKVAIPEYTENSGEADKIIRMLESYISAFNNYITSYRYYEHQIHHQIKEEQRGFIFMFLGAFSKLKISSSD